MSGFNNSILGGTALVRSAINSGSSYAPGASGWSINKDGSAEFNNVTIRGTSIIGPASGKRIVIDSSAGTITMYDSGGSITGVWSASNQRFHLSNGPQTAFMDLFVQSDVPTIILRALGFQIPGQIDVVNEGSTARLDLASPAPLGTNATSLALHSESSLGVGASAVLNVGANASWTFTEAGGGGLVKTGVTWVTPGVLGSGWAIGPAGGTIQNLQYRLDAEDNLIIVGSVHTTSTTPAATLFTLAGGYIPKVTQRAVGVKNTAGSVASVVVEAQSSGAVTVSPIPGTVNSDIYFQVCVPMGNIS